MVLGPGCTPAQRPPRAKTKSTPYYPLEVGNVWVYQGPGHNRRVKVSRKEVVDGIPCSLVETYIDEKLVFSEHYFSNEKGVFVMKSGDVKFSDPWPILKLPPAPNRAWPITFRKGNQVTKQTSLILRETKVKVPLGSFAAIPVEVEVEAENGRGHVVKYWFAKGIGIVKQVKYLQGKKVVYDLKQFLKGNQ